MKQIFFLFDLQKASTRDFCREIVEKTAQIELANDKIRLNHDEYGKPYLEHDEHFVSYSHTGNSLFVTLSENPIGVDFECKDRRCELEKMREYAFSEKDLVPDGIDLLELWCLKEASLKKKGIGFLFANPNEYTLVVNDRYYELRIDDKIIDRGFYKIKEKGQYVFAICSEIDISNCEIKKCIY